MRLIETSIPIYEKLNNHFIFWEFNENTPLIPTIIQNLNAAFAVTSVTLPVSISLCLSINFFVQSNNHISPAIGVITNSMALIFCFLLSGRTHLFKSFSALQAYFVMLIVMRFGVEVLPWISFVLGLMMLLATFLKFQNLIYLIPTCITISLKNTIGILIIINEIVHAFGIHEHPPNNRLFDAMRYVATHRKEARFTEFVFFSFVSISLFYLVRKVRNLPWFLIFTVGSIIIGYIFQSHKDVMTISVPFSGYKELMNYFKQPFNHFFNFEAFWNKALTGEFFMHMVFFTLAVFLEAVTSLRIARSQTDRESDKDLELISLSFTNLIFGCFGLLPVSIPVARNVLAFETGASNKIYYLLSAFLLFSSAFLFWPVMEHFPSLTVSAFNTCLGLMMIDIRSLISMVNISPFLAIPITVLILGSMYVDIFTSFAVSLVIFYVYYFNISGFEHFRIEKVEIFFEDVIRHQKRMKIRENSTLFESKEETVCLNAVPNGLSEGDLQEHGEEEVELTKDNFMDDGLVYTLLGTFNFFNYELHYNNLRYFNKSYICLNFSEIIKHDLDFFQEYKNLIEILDESGYEVFITGITMKQMTNDVSFRKIRWLSRKKGEGKILYTRMYYQPTKPSLR